MKKLLSILLTVLLVAGLSVTVMADEPANVVGYSADRVVPVDLADVWCISDYYDSPLTTTAYKIVDAQDLVKFAGYVNDGEAFAGKTIYLAFDINMTDVAFTPVGKVAASAFKGTFDGQGHVIDNLVCTIDGKTSDIKNIGLFGNTVNATIKNLVLGSNCSFTYTHADNDYTNVRIAAIVGNMRAGTTIDNVYTAAAVTGGNYVGGITAFSDPGPDATPRAIKNTTQAGAVHAKAGRVGGVVGLTAGTALEIRNCRNAGSVTSDGTDANWASAGGFIGDCWNSADSLGSVLIDGCINNGAIKGGSAGGFFGKIQREVTLTNSLNYGTTEGNVVGGLVAKINNEAATVLTDSEDKSQSSETDATLSTLPTITPDYPTPDEITAEKNSYKNNNNNNNNNNDNTNDTTEPSGDTTTAEKNTTAAPTPDTTPSTTAPTTEAPAEEKKGCGSVVAGGIALVMLTACAALTVCKKKD